MNLVEYRKVRKALQTTIDLLHGPGMTPRKRYKLTERAKAQRDELALLKSFAGAEKGLKTLRSSA